MALLVRRGYADAGSVQIHYRVLGDGPPLVLLHATPRSSRVYERLMPLLAAGGFRVYAFDTPGFGYSDPLPADPSMEALAGLIVQAMDSLGLSKVDLFGLHTGNKIGAALAAGWPDRISRFVCVGMTHSIVIDKQKRAGAILDLVQKGLDGTTVSADGGHLVKRWAATFGSVAKAWWNAGQISKPVVSESDLRLLENEVLDIIQARHSFDAIYAQNFRFDLGEAFARIPVPTLVVELATAQEDHLGRQAEAVARLLPKGQAVTLESTDRGVLEDNPAALAAVVLPFLKA